MLLDIGFLTVYLYYFPFKKKQPQTKVKTILWLTPANNTNIKLKAIF